MSDTRIVTEAEVGGAWTLAELIMEQVVRVGERVARRRQALGLSERQAAALVGCAQSTLSRLEAGSQVPTPALLAKLSSMLGLDLRELYALSGYELPNELPELRPYMRMKFKRLPSSAFGEIETFIEYLHVKYGVARGGPDPGRDEVPDGHSSAEGDGSA